MLPSIKFTPCHLSRSIVRASIMSVKGIGKDSQHGHVRTRVHVQKGARWVSGHEMADLAGNI